MKRNELLDRGIARVMGAAGRFCKGDAAGRGFLAMLAPALRESRQRRQQHEVEGLHIPPLLIASIASCCNLHCSGCYARAGGSCSDAPSPQLSAAQWEDVFAEAEALGVSFVLLAGGEPLLRRDVLAMAAGHPRMVFPVFTNGTMIDAQYIALFEAHRQLIPVFSIEGEAAATDARRGAGTHAKISAAMEAMSARHLLFGASITLTRETLHQAVSEEFVALLRSDGCGLLFFVEYVPAEVGSEALVLRESELNWLHTEIAALKRRFPDMMLISFPGDEAAMGGCLAAGRGFFHINPSGGAEACPFAPVSACNVRTAGLRGALEGPFFARVRAVAAQGDRGGGCALFGREGELVALRDSETV